MNAPNDNRASNANGREGEAPAEPGADGTLSVEAARQEARRHDVKGEELPTPTRKTPLPRVTILGATAALLIPLGAIALLFWATRSTPAQDALSAEQKLRELQASEEQQMTTYGWTDKSAGVVRIPVSRAKEMILKEAEKKP